MDSRKTYFANLNIHDNKRIKIDMDYKEKYEAALGWMKDLYPTLQGATKEDAEHYFPELKGSDDERIRKALIEGFKVMKDGSYGECTFSNYNIPVTAIITWLEKQGEQKPTDKVEPQKELAETYLTVFDKKFPILPTLRGKQLADYKNFLNKCQQIFGLKYWGIRPLQAKLFEKLSLLWAAWGAEHLQGIGRQDEKEQDIPVSEDLGEYINELSKQFPEVSFAKLSRIAVRVSRWQQNLDVKNKLPKVTNRTDLDEYAYQVAYDLSNDWAKENPTWNDVENACKLGANWQKQKTKEN